MNSSNPAPDQPTGMNKLRELDRILDNFYLGDEDKYTPEAWEKHRANAVAAIQQIVERCLPAKKTLKTDLDDDNIIGYDDPHRYCVECGQYEYEGVLNCRCVGFNQAIDQFRHNLQQAGLLRGDELTQKPAEETEGQ